MSKFSGQTFQFTSGGKIESSKASWAPKKEKPPNRVMPIRPESEKRQFPGTRKNLNEDD
jgi:hypothetical protein